MGKTRSTDVLLSRSHTSKVGKGPEVVQWPVSQGHALELAGMVLLLAAAGH